MQRTLQEDLCLNPTAQPAKRDGNGGNLRFMESLNITLYFLLMISGISPFRFVALYVCTLYISVS